jgi:hypothetical protein
MNKQRYCKLLLLYCYTSHLSRINVWFFQDLCSFQIHISDTLSLSLSLILYAIDLLWSCKVSRVKSSEIWRTVGCQKVYRCHEVNFCLLCTTTLNEQAPLSYETLAIIYHSTRPFVTKTWKFTTTVLASQFSHGKFICKLFGLITLLLHIWMHTVLSCINML